MKPGKKCPTWSKTFKSVSDLSRHVVTHDPDGKVKCEVSIGVKISKSEAKYTTFLHFRLP